MAKRNSRNKLIGISIGISAIAVSTSLVLLRDHVSPLAQVQAEDTAPESIHHETLELPRSLVHIIRIPADQPVQITPTIATDKLATVDTLAKEQGAIAAINGGFFDPNNQQTTSFVIQNGQIILDPTQNSRLVDNPNLSRYMPQILNRSEFRRYDCQSDVGELTKYAIALRQQPIPPNCQLLDALGAGPALLPKVNAEAEAFLDPTVGRDAIGSQTPNARSAVGITRDGSILLIMAAQRVDVPSPSGLTLTELAEIMTKLDVQQGLNLDGGSSSSLYFRGNTYNGRLDANQPAIERPVKSALAVLSAD